VNPARSRLRKWLLPAVKLLIVVLVVWFIRRTVVDAAKQLGEHPWHFDPAWLVASGLLYLAGLAAEGFFWYRVLLALGQDVKLGETLRAYFIGHLGKYVPGKAMVVVLRAGLLRGERVDRSLAAASVFLETLTMMSVGALMAAVILVAWFAPHGLLFWASLGVIAVAGLPTLPPVFARLARLAGVGRSNPEVAEKLARLGYRTLAEGWILNVVGWVLLGASLWASVRAMGTELDLTDQLPTCTAAISLAVVGGFVSFVPGGAGVREAVLLEFLAKMANWGDLVAVASALLVRLVWLMAELVISGILYIGLKRKGKHVIDRHSGL
jgi:glycosyltransferase 2 family protein